jgi:hypothetical protein
MQCHDQPRQHWISVGKPQTRCLLGRAQAAGDVALNPIKRLTDIIILNRKVEPWTQ